MIYISTDKLVKVLLLMKTILGLCRTEQEALQEAADLIQSNFTDSYNNALDDIQTLIEEQPATISNDKLLIAIDGAWKDALSELRKKV